MKGDILKYENVYQIIKNKIECGLLKEGGTASVPHELPPGDKPTTHKPAYKVYNGSVLWK